MMVSADECGAAPPTETVTPQDREVWRSGLQFALLNRKLNTRRGLFLGSCRVSRGQSSGDHSWGTNFRSNRVGPGDRNSAAETRNFSCSQVSCRRRTT